MFLRFFNLGAVSNISFAEFFMLHNAVWWYLSTALNQLSNSSIASFTFLVVSSLSISCPHLTSDIFNGASFL
jgi:hypothetical protein